MNESTLKVSLGLALIFSHAIVIVFVVAYYLSSALLYNELIQILAILTPLFAMFASVAIKAISANRFRSRKKEIEISRSFSFISFFYPVAYVLSVLALIAVYGATRKLSFPELVTLLGMAEAAFAVYSVKIVSDIYGDFTQATSKANISPRSKSKTGNP